MPIHNTSFKNPFEQKHHEVIWKDNFPYSKTYQDRFFQKDAVAEIENIFIEPNKLIERFQNGARICIGELGFGFGLNFFVTAKLWVENRKSSRQHNLEYLAIDEALPTKAQIDKLISNFPELEEICNIFLESYDMSHNDLQRIYFPSLKIRLTLIQNNAQSGLRNLLGFENNKIDAWYLDGFDPAKNQSMWSNSIFQYIGFLSSENATFGTFTSAGFVKRGMQKFGFEVDRVKGFGNKRHKLIGARLSNHAESKTKKNKE